MNIRSVEKPLVFNPSFKDMKEHTLGRNHMNVSSVEKPSVSDAALNYI